MGVGDTNGDGYGDLLVGAAGFEEGRGKAYLYCGSAEGLSDKPCWSAKGENKGDQFGDRLGQAGDLNGDGFADVYVSEPSWKGGPGRCVVFLGGPNGLESLPSWAVNGAGAESEQFGDCTHPTGDVNGDGYDDLVVGAYQALSSAGRAQLFLGGPQGLAKDAVWETHGERKGDQYAYSLGSAGDVDGDGRGDFLVGAKFYDNAAFGSAATAKQAGKAYLYLGTATGLSPSASWTLNGWNPEEQLGVRTHGAGDLDGDGRPEILISAPGANGGQGRFQVHRSPGLEEVGAWHGGSFGLVDFARGAAPAGDVNGDGYGDVIVSGRRVATGVAMIFLGGARGLSKQPAWVLEGESVGDRFGLWVAPAGDLDGDGLADVVVSADSFSGERSLSGKVYVVYGKQLVATPSHKPQRKGLNVYLPQR